MIKFSQSILVGAVALLWAGAASATPIVLTFESSTSADATFPSTQTFTPSLPFNGAGDIDEAAGTYHLTLPTYSLVINIAAFGAGDDAGLEITNWSQTGTFAGGAGGNLTGTASTGNVACTDLGGGGGALVCAQVPPTTATWPPTGAAGPTFGAAGAVIDIATNTITVTEPWDTNGGQIQTVYTYAFVPEPGTMLLLGTGLAGLFMTGRRRA